MSCRFCPPTIPRSLPGIVSHSSALPRDFSFTLSSTYKVIMQLLVSTAPSPFLLYIQETVFVKITEQSLVSGFVSCSSNELCKCCQAPT